MSLCSVEALSDSWTGNPSSTLVTTIYVYYCVIVYSRMVYNIFSDYITARKTFKKFPHFSWLYFTNLKTTLPINISPTSTRTPTYDSIQFKLVIHTKCLHNNGTFLQRIANILLEIARINYLHNQSVRTTELLSYTQWKGMTIANHVTEISSRYYKPTCAV